MLGSSSIMGSGAGRDLCLQVAIVRELAAGMPRADKQVTAGARELPPGPTQVVTATSAHTWPERTLYADEDLQQRLDWARGLRQEAGATVLRALERAAALGAQRRIAVSGSAKDFDELRANFPNFSRVCDFVWRRALLAGSVGDRAFRIPPILLDGPPGVGKTEFAQRLADWLGTPMARVDMGALDTSFKLTGLDSGYSTGRPGAIWDALQGPCMSPVVLLDELDKRCHSTSDSGHSFLLALLEPSTATRFEDSCIGLAINASWIQWIATANDISAIDPAVVSRFRVFEVCEPTREQSRAVVASVYVALRNREAWAQAFPAHLPEPVVEELAGRTAREVWQALEDACATAVARNRRELRADDVPAPQTSGRRRMGFTP